MLIVFYSVLLFKYSSIIAIAWSGVSLIPDGPNVESSKCSWVFLNQVLKMHHRCNCSLSCLNVP